MMKRSHLAIVFWLGICLFALSCGPTPSPPVNSAYTNEHTIGKRGGMLTYRLTSPPKTFNYLLADDESTVLVAFSLLQSRLVDLDHRTQKYVPALAESWTRQADGRTVDLKLRDDLKFSDGDDLTAEDVAFTFAAVYDERTNSPVFRDSVLVGGKPIEVKAIDAAHLQFVFPEAVPAVENYFINLGILPKHKLEADLNSGKLSEVWKLIADPKSIVTSGPFIVKSAAAGERTTLSRNPNYWKRDSAGTQLPYVDNLVLEVISDANQTLARLEQNALDIADRIRPADYTSLTNSSGPARAVDLGPGLGIDYLWFNLNRTKANGEVLNPAKLSWFEDKRFRKAVGHAIDRATIATTTLRGLATPLNGFVSPANKVWADGGIPKISYDLQKAETVLAEAGFVKRGTADSPELHDAAGNRVEFTLLVPSENEPRKLMAALIQQDLARLGITMQVAPIEFQGLTERWSKSFDYDAILLGLSLTDLEPSSYANFLLSSAATHQWQPSQKTPATTWEARIDELFAQQARETDPERRRAAFFEIQRIMAEEMPVVPIVARHVASAANKRIGNYSPSSILPYSLWNIEELFIK